MASGSKKTGRIDLDGKRTKTVRGYDIQKVIGKGTFGIVYLVKKGKQELAMKEVDLSELHVKDVEHCLQEGKTMQRFTHPNLVKLHEFFQQEKKFYIVMEHCARGSLKDYLTNIHRDLEEREVLDFMIDVSRALQYLHKKGLIHRDVKTDNIFMTKDRKLKLGDMALARECKPDFAMTSLTGTPVYMSPEVIEDRYYDQKADVWSLGCCFYEMCHRQGLFSFATSIETLEQMLRMSESRPMTIKQHVCGELESLFKAMISYHAPKRPAIDTILKCIENHNHDSDIRKHRTLAKRSISDQTGATDIVVGRRVGDLQRIKSWSDGLRESPRDFKTSDYETDIELRKDSIMSEEEFTIDEQSERKQRQARPANFKIYKTAMQKLLDERSLPTQGDIQSAYDAGETARFEQLTHTAREHIRNHSNLIRRVSVAYSVSLDSGFKEIVFIAFTEKFDKLNIHLPYTTVFRKIEEYSLEGVSIIYSKESLGKPFTKEESTKITNTLRKHSENLMKQHCNIQMISACSVKSKGFGTFSEKIIPTTCIVIYVDIKGLIPINESLLPNALDDIPVDVREGGPRPFKNEKPSDRQPSLKMGCQISSDTELGYGTLGAFVEEPDSKKLYCLTCAHVVASPTDFKNTDGTLTFFTDNRKVYQPIPGEFNQIGSVEKAVFKSGEGGDTGVDVALISVETRPPIDGEFPAGDFQRAGFDSGRPMVYTSGEVYTRETMPDQYESRSELIKFGASSGPTRGSFFLNGTSVQKHTLDGNYMNFGYKLFNQFEVLSLDPYNVRPFAEDGDSGSLVFFPHNGKCSDLRAVGILEGGTSNNTYIVTPIWEVLNSLNLPLRLKTFPLHATQATSLASSLEFMSLESTPSSSHQTTRQTNVEERIDALRQELLDDADRREQAISRELAEQNLATQTKMDEQNITTQTKMDALERKMDTLMDNFAKLFSKLDKSST